MRVDQVASFIRKHESQRRAGENAVDKIGEDFSNSASPNRSESQDLDADNKKAKENASKDKK
jgi:hypothetical protein